MFGTDFRTARIADRTVKFTVAESRLLEFLSRHPGQTLSRGQIVEAIYDDGAHRSDRSIDFLINRLRRKLDDSPRAPRFIETRYGGGYVWLGPAGRAPAAKPADAVAVVGPLTGLDLLGTSREAGLAFAQGLAEALERDIGAPVRLEAGRPAEDRGDEGTGRFQVELSYFRQGALCECILTCRSRLSGQVFYVHRQPLLRESAPWRANGRAAAALVPGILAARWRQDADHIATAAPIGLAMHDAAFGDRDTRVSLTEIEPILVRLENERSGDPEVALMRASNLHTQMISKASESFREGLEACLEIDAEIERLVQGALPWCQDKPDSAMLAAKLLYYVDPRYKPLALELAEKAHRECTAIASSLAMFGQLKSFVGETDEAIDHLRQAVALTPEKSRFRHYVQVLLCQVLVAADRREELEPVRAEICRYHPLVRVHYEQVFGDPDRPSLRARGAAFAASRRSAAAMLRYCHHTAARLFEHPEHREATMCPVLSLYVRRHGREVVPPEVRASVPALFGD